MALCVQSPQPPGGNSKLLTFSDNGTGGLHEVEGTGELPDGGHGNAAFTGGPVSGAIRVGIAADQHVHAAVADGDHLESGSDGGVLPMPHLEPVLVSERQPSAGW